MQTDPIKMPEAKIQKEDKKVQESLPSGRSSKMSLDKSTPKHTPLKQSRVANITLDSSF